MRELNIISESENFWMKLSNQLFGEEINIETFLDKIELNYPLNAYFKFVKDYSEQIKKDSLINEETNNKEFRNALYKQKWEQLDPVIKERYIRDYYEAIKKYYYESLLVRKYLLLYYYPIKKKVSSAADIFAVNMALILINNDEIYKKYNYEYTPLEFFLKA